MRLTARAGAGLFAAAVGVFFYAYSFDIRQPPSLSTLSGPRIFPQMTGLALAALGLLFAVNETLNPTAFPEEERPGPFDYKAFGLTLGSLVLFILLLPRLGFIIAETAMFGIVAMAFGARRPLQAFGAALIVAPTVYHACTQCPPLRLPVGDVFRNEPLRGALNFFGWRP